MLTREEKLYTMNGATLIMLADKLGVKVRCNRTRNGLKEAKSAVIERILAVENTIAKNKFEEITPTSKPVSDIIHKDESENNSCEEKQKETSGSNQMMENKKLSPKRGAQLEFNGKSQNICTWAKELGISANTLYGRIYRMGWSIEKAFTTPSKHI